ncbi:MAG: DUF5606 domain-containing protein, partial [Bacteroidales bacterium]|nr:DUF5606 domain-containing protein [Candidatus Sodaliphilus limicaballi]
TILSISGKPGLYKLISYGKNLLIVESLVDGKRTPATARDKIISLGDIAIYTLDQEVPLAQVMDTISKQFDGKQLNAADYKTGEQLADFFKSVLPNYDEERVYNNDIKKVISWYNILVGAGITEFVPAEENAAEEAIEEEAKEA